MKKIALGLLLALLTACSNSPSKPENELGLDDKSILERVDFNAERIVNYALDSLNMHKVAILDHHRMAQEVGVYMPPAVACMFSEPRIEIPLIEFDPLIALDFPFKVLSYSEPDTAEAYLAFTSSQFIAQRHGIDPYILNDYEKKMNQLLSSSKSYAIIADTEFSVDSSFGIVQMTSDFSLDSTISRLKSTVLSQGDTRWFADIEYHKEAARLGKNIKPVTLLLFGGPGPGGKAMMNSPRIGLDAFCQKLLVYEDDKGQILIAFNDIVAFANLYYQKSSKPQKLINQRLIATFNKAIKR